MVLQATAAGLAQPAESGASVTEDCPPGYYCEPPDSDVAETPEGPVAPRSSEQKFSNADDDALGSEVPPGEQSPVGVPVEGPAVQPPHDPGLAPPLPPPPVPKAYARWELAARAGLPVFDAGAQRDAFMITGGLALRRRLARYAAVEVALDAAGGKDYVGASRWEGWFAPAFRLNASPSGVAPFVAIGPALSFARVDDDGTRRQFSYFGGAVSFGLTIPISQSSGFEVLWSSFLRTRVPSTGSPEYVDPGTGRTTNTSGGALIRAGLSLAL